MSQTQQRKNGADEEEQVTGAAAADSETVTGQDGESNDETMANPHELVETETPDHWRLAWSGALLSAGAALTLSAPALLLAPVAVLGVLVLRQTAEPPDPTLNIERTVSPETPDPGDTVDVELTVTNVGSRTLPDCRIIDGVPGEPRVTSGSPRAATRLRPEASTTLSYELTPGAGKHSFEGVSVVVGDRVGTHEHEYEFDADDEILARPRPAQLQTPVLRKLTTPYAGRLSTEKPGEGLEFHSVREYRTGDPLKRIDWNQYAASRELATLEFRTERSAAVVLVADVRQGAYVRAAADDAHAADRGLDAVGRLLVTLLETDHRVGLTTLGPEFWIPPGSGTEHRNRLLDALAEQEAFSSRPPTAEFPIRLRTLQLLIRMTETTQVLICTPLLDDRVEIQIQMLESAGHEVAVVSPNPSRMETAGGIVASLERKERISRIHGYGVPVVDWPLDGDLDIAVSRTMEGWSR